MKHIARDLRTARVSEGWTQADLAKAALCTNETISLIELGKVTPFASTRRRIEYILGKIDWDLTKDKASLYRTTNGVLK